MMQDEDEFDNRESINKSPSNAAHASRIQLRWRKHQAKRMASTLDICVGMQVERVLDNKWHPAVVSRVYTTNSSVVDIIYTGFEEETEDVRVNVSFIRAATTVSLPLSNYASTGKKWQRVWEPVNRGIDEIVTSDDTRLDSTPRERGELRRRSKSFPRLTSDPTILPSNDPMGKDLRPLSGRCEYCFKLSMYRCHSCSLVYYCSRICQRKSWPKHQVLCCPPSARYRYKEPFKPLFTDTSLLLLTKRRQALVTKTDHSNIVSVIALEGSLTPSAPLMDDVMGISGLYDTPVRRQRESSAKVHPDAIGVESRNQNVRALSFTGASLEDIKKALEVHHNDVNAAANWLLMHDGYMATNTYSDMSSLVPDTGATMNNTEVPIGPVKPSREQMQSWSAETSQVGWVQSSQIGWGQETYDHELEPSAPSIASPSSSLANEHLDKSGGSHDSTATVSSEDDEVVRVSDDDDSHMDIIAHSLCDMLSGVSIEMAKDALKSFKDPNQAAEWLMLHPGESPSHRNVGTNSNPKHSQSRATTPTLRSAYDDLD